MDDDNMFDVDDLNKIRVLDNETSTKTAQLKEECKDFIDSKSLALHFKSFQRMCKLFVYTPYRLES